MSTVNAAPAVTDDVHKNGFTQEYLMKGMTKEKEVVAS